MRKKNSLLKCTFEFGMKSEFRAGFISVVILAMCAIIYVIVLLATAVYRDPQKLDGITLMIMIFLSFLSLLTLREAKFKWNKIEVTENGLLIKPWLGLWTERIAMSEISGYTKAVEQSRYSDGQAMYLYVKGNRKVEISDAYFANFALLAAEFKLRKIKKLGKERPGLAKVLLNMFGKPIEIPKDLKS